MKKTLIYYLLLSSAAFYSCEKLVDVSLNEVEDYLVVDAWLTHTNEDQVIRLTLTQPYYDNSFAEGVAGATVTVSDDAGNTFEFIDQGNGDYVWPATDTFGVVGRSYILEVEANSQVYTATSQLNRVPPIDSITYTLEADDPFASDYYYSEFFGTDPEGEGDAYWLKAWRNGKYLNQPDEIYLFYDASFGEGNGDGIPFIFPIRVSANPYEVDINNNFIPYYLPADSIYANGDGEFTINESKGKVVGNELVLIDEDEDTEVKGGVVSYKLDGAPYLLVNDNLIFKEADSLYLELHSLTDEAWFFLLRLQEETNRPGGFGALFATPPSNVPTNIETEGETRVAGFFSIAGVSTKGRKLTEDAIREQPEN